VEGGLPRRPRRGRDRGGVLSRIVTYVYACVNENEHEHEDEKDDEDDGQPKTENPEPTTAKQSVGDGGCAVAPDLPMGDGTRRERTRRASPEPSPAASASGYQPRRGGAAVPGVAVPATAPVDAERTRTGPRGVVHASGRIRAVRPRGGRSPLWSAAA
jgi:hypothetical protein